MCQPKTRMDGNARDKPLNIQYPQVKSLQGKKYRGRSRCCRVWTKTVWGESRRSDKERKIRPIIQGGRRLVSRELPKRDLEKKGGEVRRQQKKGKRPHMGTQMPEKQGGVVTPRGQVSLENARMDKMEKDSCKYARPRRREDGAGLNSAHWIVGRRGSFE